MKLRSTCWIGVMISGAALGAPKVLSVAVGDCGQPELLKYAAQFSDALNSKAGSAFVNGSSLAPVLRPQSKQTIEEIERQLKLAKDQYYSALSASEFAAVETRVQSALEEIGRLLPGKEREKLMMEARLRLALALQRQEKRDKERAAEESLRQILKVLPRYELDPQWFTPELRDHFEALRKEVRRLPTYVLKVESVPNGEVFIDGIHVGKTPFEKAFPGGKYDVSVTQKEQVSFAHAVALTEDANVRIDLSFEAAISNPGVLCLSLPPDNEQQLIQAIKLGAALRADVVVAAILEKKAAGLFWLSASSVSVDTAQKTRAGAITFAPEENSQKKIEALANFILTGAGSPDIAKQFLEPSKFDVSVDVVRKSETPGLSPTVPAAFTSAKNVLSPTSPNQPQLTAAWRQPVGIGLFSVGALAGGAAVILAYSESREWTFINKTNAEGAFDFEADSLAAATLRASRDRTLWLVSAGVSALFFAGGGLLWGLTPTVFSNGISVHGKF